MGAEVKKTEGKMSGSAEAEKLCSAIETSARLMNIDCSREKVFPVVTAYAETLPEAVVSFSVASGKGRTEELDYTITVPPESRDPYTTALANGLVPPTDHPAGTLLSAITERCPVRGYFVDSGVVAGFKKAYAFFPPEELQTMPELAGIPGMPSGLAESIDTFARYGLDDKVRMIAIDYQNATFNVYFGSLPAACREPESVRSMIRELGLPNPDEQVLEYARKSFSIYVTYTWGSADIERICFAIPPSPALVDFPDDVEPEIDHFARNAPYAYEGERTLIYAITWSPGGEHYKLGSYYRLPPRARKLLMPVETGAEQA